MRNSFTLLLFAVLSSIIRKFWFMAVIGIILAGMIGLVAKLSGGTFLTAVAYAGSGLAVIAAVIVILFALNAIKNGFK